MLHPGQLNSPISTPSSDALLNAVWNASLHSGEKVSTGPRLSVSILPMSAMYARSMPARFIASMSFAAPSDEMFPQSQYQ